MEVGKPEILAPGGNLEKLKFAIRYGADAVYIGGQQYSLRANADNFSFAEMEEGVQFAHEHGAKVYVATNIIAHDEDLDGLEEYLQTLERIGIDAIIVADPAIIETAQRVAPGLEIHLSTQVSTTNWQAVQFWHDEVGIPRVVTGREVSIAELREMKEKTGVEIEAFIHGAMCMSYSGRCTMSNHMTARDSNRGGCSQSCRWQYDLFEAVPNSTTGQPLEIPLFTEQDDPYTMSSKDLCLIHRIPQLIEAGVDSFKIEGRMKSLHYVATVARVYRQAVDAYFEDPEHFVVKPEWFAELNKAATRATAEAFALHLPGSEEIIYGEEPNQLKRYDFTGVVLAYDPVQKLATIQQRNHFKVSQEVEFFGPDRENFSQVIEQIWDEEGHELDAARHPLQIVKVPVAQPVQAYDLMRKEL
ncbi:peptidase U32 family protein [Rubeoparvulum massiliense]|uniref:peptidase U32 family protein n=1 Tax=Rubeoparvulum massiliense TaxID=1631346 RepID=UPI00065E96B4|nr:U32 family peptidase [Rubeoparvulum massiliense]